MATSPAPGSFASRLAGLPPRASLAHRFDWSAIAWGAGAAILALIVGLVAGADERIAISAALLVGATAAIVSRPFALLAGLLLVRATVAEAGFIDLLTVAGGVGALLILAPTLPVKRVTVPFLALLLLALPTVPFVPGLDEGTRSQSLYLPNTAIAYLPIPSARFSEFLRLASLLILFSFAALVVREPRRLKILVQAILVSGIGPVCIGLYQIATGQTTSRGNAGVDAISGPFDSPNYFGFYLLVLLALAVVSLLEARKLGARLGLTVLVVAASACLVATYTRSAWIGFIVVLAVLAVLRYRRLLLVCPLVLALALAGLPSTVDSIDSRLTNTSSGSNNVDSWKWRTGQWERMIPHGLERPLTGVGFGDYHRATLKEFGRTDPDYSTVGGPGAGLTGGFSAHNDYVKMFVEMGLPGLLLWTTVLLMLLVSVAAARGSPAIEAEAIAVMALLVSFLIISASDNVQGYTVVGIYLFVLAGGVIGVHQSTRRSRRVRGHNAPANLRDDLVGDL